ncbi:MAG: hypothetical protein Kow0058_19150 [Roseovarius sp.]
MTPRISARLGLPRIAAALLVAALPGGPALAHVGHGAASGLVAGMGHPVSGLDHMTAMLVVGLIAARHDGIARLAPPAAFVAAMVAGGIAGMAGLMLPDVAVEGFIALSLVLLGLLLAASLGLPAAALLPAIALFGAFHGLAHGAEAPETASGLAYLAGFVTVTALLHLAGIALGSVLRRLPAHAGRIAAATLGLGAAGVGLPLLLAAVSAGG